jgi:hypothetical protein
MQAGETYGAHSAQVTMRLIVNGSSIRITHMGPDFILIDSPTEHAPCKARLFLQVDDNKSEWEVTLPEGISGKSNRVALAPADQVLNC